jgi:6-phosphogluconolactonase
MFAKTTLRLSLLFALLFSVPLKAQVTRFLVGTTDRKVQESVVVCQIDEQKETLSVANKLNAGIRPGYITLHKDRLYAVSIDEQGQDEQTLRAFELIDRGADLKLLSEVSCKGINPCHISVDAKGKGLYAANYTSGSIVQYQIKPDGSLGDHWYFQQFTGSSVDEQRQQAPHAHYINTTVDNKYALTADLGTDKVMVHGHHKSGKLQVNEAQPYFKLPPGSGPRHLEFHPNNHWIYVLNELSSTITTVRYQKGKFTVGKTISTLPQDFKQESKAAAVRIHPSGKYIYSSNRGSDSISVFAIDENGDLTRLQTFEDGLGWVRDFNITPSGKFIVAGNERNNQVALLRVGSNGQIDEHLTSIALPAPSCFVFLK